MEDSDANTPTPEKPPTAAEPASGVPGVTPAGQEDRPPASEPTSPEPTPESPAPAPSDDPLEPLLTKSASQRLSAPEEEQAIGIIRDRLHGKKDEVIGAIGLLPRVGWAVASKSVGAAWPEMKASARTLLIKSLAADESDASRRVRLSVARSLFKVPDIAAALKLITGVAKEIRDKDTGGVSQRDAQMFSNVMIGKGKPWIALLPLDDAKPADADTLVQVTVSAAFVLNQPPITQIGVIKWASDTGRLTKLPESVLASLLKGVGRMSGKWQNLLKKEVAELPEAIVAVLKPAEPVAPATAEAPAGEDEDDDDGLPSELKGEEAADSESNDEGAGDERRPRKERPVYVSKTVPPREQRSPERTPQPSAAQPAQREGREPREPRDREARESREPREGREPREPKGPPARSTQFNATEMLRQLETHIGFLKGELKTAETKLRSREDDSRKAKRRPDVPVIEGEPTLEELARLNIQLEARITELQSRIEDLTADSEARATSAGAFAEQPVTNPDEQLRTLLSLKLQEAYADFLALEQEDRDMVVPQHFQTVLREVFRVLKDEGVPLIVPPAPEISTPGVV